MMFTKIFPELFWIKVIACIIAVVVLLGLNSGVKSFIEEKLGLQTKATLKEQVYTQESIIRDLTVVNKDLLASSELKDLSNSINNAVIGSVAKDAKKLNTNFNDINNKKNTKIDNVKKDFESKPTTVENTIEKEKEISSIQIGSLWDVYCSGVKDNSSCGV